MSLDDDLDRPVPFVAGLDLSITATGCAQPDGSVETWRLPASEGDRRLAVIRNRVAALVSWHPLELVAIEDLPTHAHGAGITGMVHGAARTALIDAAVPYVLITPATLKKYATGKGNAGKPDMAVALYKRTGLELADDNQVDAYFLRAAVLQHLGHPLFTLPAAQVAALDVVAWP